MNDGVKALAALAMPVETWTVEPSTTRDVVLVLDHFRPERHAVTQLYNTHFLGVVYIVDATGWPGCLKIRPAQACKLQYREFFPGDGHYRAVAALRNSSLVTAFALL